MFFNPYDRMYLEDVEENIGQMLETAKNLELNINDLWNKFIISDIAKGIEEGHCRYLSGLSGVDFIYILIKEISNRNVSPKFYYDEYYWAGMAIAKLQFETGKTFKELNDIISIEEVVDLYNPLHEADLSKFVEIMMEKIVNVKKDSKLKIYRKNCNYTQNELARLANVDLRSIQMFEQGRNDINKAQALTLFKLAKVLNVKIENLLEL